MRTQTGWEWGPPVCFLAGIELGCFMVAALFFLMVVLFFLSFCIAMGLGFIFRVLGFIISCFLGEPYCVIHGRRRHHIHYGRDIHMVTKGKHMA